MLLYINGTNDMDTRAVVDKIVEDICDRACIGDAWESIDDSIREEIMKTWEKIIKKEFVKAIT